MFTLKNLTQFIAITLVLSTVSLTSQATNHIDQEITEGKIKATIQSSKKELKSPEDMIIDAEVKLESLNQQIEVIGKSNRDSNGELQKLGQYTFIIEKQLSQMYAILELLYEGQYSYERAQKEISVLALEIESLN